MTGRWMVLPLGALALACSGERPRTNDGMNDALRQDLALAEAASVELASAARPAGTVRVVSAIERVPTADRPRSARAPKPRPRRAARPAPRPAPKVAPEPEVVEAPAAVAEEPTPAEAPETTVADAAPAPAPQPEPAPATDPAPSNEPSGDAEPARGTGRGGGIGIGTVIGVVIRGGGVGDDDHCEIHDGGVIAIHRRLPIGVRIPGGQPTFPRRW